MDFSKAFDSISHKYIFETFSFLNFGDHFLKILHTMLNKRSVSLMVDGYLSSSFKIERGVPQGDTASPYIFIIVLEILILKLNNDPDILKIGINYADGITDTDPLLVFADDMTLLMNETEENLVRVRDIFANFAKLSGLEINEEKTNVIRIGTKLDDTAPITNKVSFTYATKFKILGFEIDNKLETLNENFTKKEKKINKLIYMWSKLNLSTIGNLIISKTFLISQLSYLLSVLDCPEPVLKRIQHKIDSFIMKSSKPWMSKERLYQPVEKGGLGAINLTNFSTSLKMSWARRAKESKGLWANILKSKVSSNDNICYIRKCDIKPFNKGLMPIVGAFERTVDKHNENIKRKKPLLTLTPLSLLECVPKPGPKGRVINVKPTRSSHPELYRRGKICEIRPIDLLDRLNLELGIVKIVPNDNLLNLLELNDLDPVRRRMAVLRVRKIMANITEFLMVERKQTMFPLSKVVEDTKKGSRKYRNILDHEGNLIVQPWRTIDTKFNVTVKPGNENYFKRMGKFVKCKYLSADLQTLHLNTINGRTRLNNVEAKYKRNGDGVLKLPFCTFCTLDKIVTPEIENERHFYQECPISSEVLEHVKQTFALPDNLNIEDILIFFNNEDEWLSLKVNIVMLLYRKYLNTCRKSNQLPNKNYLSSLIKSKLKLIISANPADNKLVEGFVPLISGNALPVEEIKELLETTNNKDDKLLILFDSQRRTRQLEITAMEYLASSINTGTRMLNIQRRLIELNNVE